jgi:hypothetical protein
MAVAGQRGESNALPLRCSADQVARFARGATLPGTVALTLAAWAAVALDGGV